MFSVGTTTLSVDAPVTAKQTSEERRGSKFVRSCFSNVELERQLVTASPRKPSKPGAEEGTPGSWLSVEDNDSGQIYWYHTRTLQRVWDEEMNAATKIQAVQRGRSARQRERQQEKQA